MPDQASLELGPGLTVVWEDLDRVRAGLTAEELSSPWRLEGRLGTGYTALRVLTAATREGSLLLVGAARPEGADGHDSEQPQAVLVSRSGDVKTFEEALVSTQYSASGAIERVGLELYAQGDDYPLRGAGDAIESGATEEGEVRRDRARLDFRLDGKPGHATLEILHA